MVHGTADWDRRHEVGPRPRPDPWLVTLAPILTARPTGPVLDLACGLGQNTLWAAELGAPALGVDRSEQAVARAAAEARRRRLSALFRVVDLEAGAALPEHPGGWGAVLVLHYLHRPLLSLLPNSLAPGGFLVYKTHLGHPLRGEDTRPQRPDFLLAPAELLAAFAELELLSYREWASPGAAYAALLARRPPHSW